MDISYDYYKAFYYIAREKSFTKAASILLTSQPNLSRIVKILEDTLNVKLLNREKNGLSLTDEGIILYQHLNIAIKEIENAEDILSDRLKEDIGIIRIGTTETALNLYLARILMEYHNIKPNIRFKITNYNTIDAIKVLDLNLIDLAFVTSPIKNNNSKKVLEFKDIIIGGSNFNDSYSLTELSKLPKIGLSSNTVSYKYYSDLFNEKGLSYDIDIEVSTVSEIIPLVEKNLGIAFIPKSLVKDYNMIHEIKTDLDLKERQVLMLKGNFENRITNSFINFIKNENKPN